MLICAPDLRDVHMYVCAGYAALSGRALPLWQLVTVRGRFGLKESTKLATDWLLNSLTVNG